MEFFKNIIQFENMINKKDRLYISLFLTCIVKGFDTIFFYHAPQKCWIKFNEICQEVLALG